MNECPKISVIVPVYNTEKYLRRCVDSILAQTFTDFELLLVNDGSTDGSGMICDEYAQKDSRVRVFHKENGGVSSARNLGLDNAFGELVSFVDSDDWIENNYFATLLEGVNSDLSICNCKIENSNLKWDIIIENGMQNKDSIEKLFDKGGFTGFAFLGPYCKLFRKDIIDRYDIRYRKKIYNGEDSLFVLEYFCYIDNYFGINEKLYHYWQPGNGLSGTKNLAYNFIDLARESKAIITNLSTKFNFNRDKFLANFLMDGFNAYIKHIIINSKFNKDQIEILYSVFPYEYYCIYIGGLGKLLKLSGLLYKCKLFRLFVLYLKVLREINHPFFRTIS